VRNKNTNEIVWHIELKDTKYITNQPEKIFYGQKFDNYLETTPPKKLEPNNKYSFSAEGTSNSEDSILTTTYSSFCLKEESGTLLIIPIEKTQECP